MTVNEIPSFLFVLSLNFIQPYFETDSLYTSSFLNTHFESLNRPLESNYGLTQDYSYNDLGNESRD